ncbi:hypothetical protein CEXT_750371 [Caerostris extrusa]|uniref:Uncharacterized protein n=1 Tax=Caerostris extrusa TaxID=172846 RepID=A0AAV4UKE6_CAEEX|nr:hypothetical protein CEXT_750371 [Caerostris extrusa]
MKISSERDCALWKWYTGKRFTEITTSQKAFHSLKLKNIRDLSGQQLQINHHTDYTRSSLIETKTLFTLALYYSL